MFKLIIIKMTEAEHRETCESAVVKCPGNWGLYCLILDCLIPGSGTIVSAFKDESLNKLALLFGCLQMLTCWFAVGWIWSIY